MLRLLPRRGSSSTLQHGTQQLSSAAQHAQQSPMEGTLIFECRRAYLAHTLLVHPQQCVAAATAASTRYVRTGAGAAGAAAES